MAVLSRRNFLGGFVAVSALGVFTGCSGEVQVAPGMPQDSVWSTYPVGTGTYNDVAAVANMLAEPICQAMICWPKHCPA